jgi:tricorn protease
MADARSPSWDRSGKFLYLLASTNVTPGGTSTIDHQSVYSAYVVQLSVAAQLPANGDGDNKQKVNVLARNVGDDGRHEDSHSNSEVLIDFDDIQRRIVPLPLPAANYSLTLPGLAGTVFVGEIGKTDKTTLHKFSLNEWRVETFLKDIADVRASDDGATLIYRSGDSWMVSATDEPPDDDDRLTMTLTARVDPQRECRQIFDESWRYMRDFFYDPNMHGRNWDEVFTRYTPLVSHVRHREDLRYLLDQMSGERSVGHAAIFTEDATKVEASRVGVLGVNLAMTDNRWRIERIFNTESWNPELRAPLDRPGLQLQKGLYLLAVNGADLTAETDPYRLLDGTAGQQTRLLISDNPSTKNAWTITVKPVNEERRLRQRAWVEDNRRRVDLLSEGKLAYVWVPDTWVDGVDSFNRYFYAQSDKAGAIIDERFNGGGDWADYILNALTPRFHVAVMPRLASERPHLRNLIVGQQYPCVLVINERATSGGDSFAWAFRKLKIGPLIGTRTHGGLVAPYVYYPMMDGSEIWAPADGHFDPISGRWIAENEGIPPDIEVVMDAKTSAADRDAQLERAVQVALQLLEDNPPLTVTTPPFPTPAKRPHIQKALDLAK